MISKRPCVILVADSNMAAAFRGYFQRDGWHFSLGCAPFEIDTGVVADLIVDEGGNLLAFVRMDGAKLLSRETSLSKAISAASHRQPTSRLDPALELKLAIAAGGRLTNLEGGVPIIIGGVCVGGIGVGSGKGSEDVAVAEAALAARGAEV